MKSFKNTIQLHTVFGNMARPRHVLLVIQDTNKNYLLGVKPDFYPQDVYRFVGGGVNEQEKPLEAAIREAKEELQLELTSDRLTPLAQVTTEAQFEGKTVKNVTFLFHLQVTDQDELIASDDIHSIKRMTTTQLQALIKKYSSLPIEPFFQDGDYYVCWQDYGQMYGFIHQIALDLTP